jgi:hypothetical protein
MTTNNHEEPIPGTTHTGHASPAATACLQASMLLRRRIHRDHGVGVDDEQSLLAVCQLLDALSRRLVEPPPCPARSSEQHSGWPISCTAPTPRGPIPDPTRPRTGEPTPDRGEPSVVNSCGPYWASAQDPGGDDPTDAPGRGLAHELRAELGRLSLPFTEDTIPSAAELRIAQAQLVGWLEGLFHGLQTALSAQQMAARAQLEQLLRGLPSGTSPQQGEGGLGPRAGPHL